ncbi:MAG: exodeoxyribonuclease V subunit gamma [Proteobacteria bacterium]|nr:exodeoxyribonuclease V subunit gamma [Pseudomonadota bacterium]
MFRLYTSNDAAKLATRLGKRLRAPHANPLQPARVLVPQAGLKRWLQAHLAEQLGVIANVEFVPPAQFTWELLRAARPDLPAHSPFDVEVLRWHLYDLLGTHLEGKALAPLRAYLTVDGDPLRRYALSFELARAFERMQGYRREKLLKWERGEGSADWQAELWRRLLPRVGGSSRAARVDDWLRRFDPEHPGDPRPDKPAPPGLPERFACFACANVSPDVLRMLAVAGLHCDVDFYLPLPSREYLGDTPQRRGEVHAWLHDKQGGNPLIVSQGGALAGFVELLYGYQQVRPDEEHACFVDITGKRVLDRVRRDLLNHALPDDGTALPALPDDSLQFHACHTPLREVQTLHDALLAMLDDPRFEPPLQPRDIAVMLPDLTAYRPAIEAVFGGIAHADPRWLPFNLGDGGAATLHPVAELFLKLLEAPASRWEIDELVDVLAAPGVMRRFDLDPDAVEHLSRNLRDAGVRWGEDEHARAGVGDYRDFSWAFGVDRMLAGFACGDADDALTGGVVPLAGIEGAAFAHLDAVLAVTTTWRHLRDLSRRTQAPVAWQQAFNAILESLYEPDPRDMAESRALERIRGALARLVDDCAATGAQLELPWPDVRACLRDALATPDPQQHLFTGGITFCGMVPLRVVPFRVICLLGMDETAFPRRETNGLDPLLADRRAGSAEKGDRDVRADDRLLFLQLLAAARDAFYVSWIGRDAHTNEERPPSVVVAELIDLVRGHYLARPADDDEAERRNALLPRVEPLHPFAPELFGADGKPPRSHHAEWLPAAVAPQRNADGPARFVAQPLPASEHPVSEITLEELKRFFDDPARGFLEGALRLRLPRDTEGDGALEPLDPANALLRYALSSTLLEYNDADGARQRELLRAQGQLPPGALADAALAEARPRADAIREAIAVFTGGAAPLDALAARVEFDDGAVLSGNVADRYATGLVRASTGKLNGKRTLAAWIDTLLNAAATGAPARCRLLWLDKDKAQVAEIVADDPAAARRQLAALVGLMRDGSQAPLPLFPKASWDALKRTRKKGEADFDEFLREFRKLAGKDEDDAYAPGSEFAKPAVQLAWRGIDLADPDDALSRSLYDTAHAALPMLTFVPAVPR